MKLEKVKKISIELSLLMVLFGACSDEQDSCGDYPTQASSEYVLPWKTGVTFSVYTGNCDETFNTHMGDRKYAYDFNMPVGTPITAARAGGVIVVVDEFSDDDHTFSHENIIFVKHEDDTFSLYFHIMQNGSIVAVGDKIKQGDVLGLSGTSGSIGPDLVPHLHFEVASQVGINSILSIPTSFLNTRSHPDGLIEGEKYLAEPY